MRSRHDSQGVKAKRKRRLPVSQYEDVEYSAELADEEDLRAQARAEAADRRQSE